MLGVRVQLADAINTQARDNKVEALQLNGQDLTVVVWLDIWTLLCMCLAAIVIPKYYDENTQIFRHYLGFNSI